MLFFFCENFFLIANLDFVARIVQKTQVAIVEVLQAHPSTLHPTRLRRIDRTFLKLLNYYYTYEQ